MENEKIIPEMENETSEVAETVETKEAVAVEAETPEATETVAEEAPEIQEEKPAGYCTKCGTPYKEGQSFCANCGAPLNASVPAQPVAAAPSAPVTSPVPGQYIVQQPVAAKPKKKGKKKLIAVIASVLVFIIAFVSISCLEQDDVEGTYSGSYTYKGNSYTIGLVLGEDGKYAEVTYKNGRYYKMETGYYDVEGGTVNCHPSDSIGTTPYQYVFGQLENNNHYFSRSEKN